MQHTSSKVLRAFGYAFEDDSLLTRALTHRSVGARHNERLEFLGDALLGMVIAEYLFATFPGVQGGTGHLWWAIAMAVLACGTAFLVFSVFVRHDTDDDLHITSTRRA